MIILAGWFDFEKFYLKAKFQYDIAWMDTDYGYYHLLVDLHIIDDCQEVAKLQAFASIYDLDIFEVDDEDYDMHRYYFGDSQGLEELWELFLSLFLKD